MGNGEWAMVNGQFFYLLISAAVIQYLYIAVKRFSGTARKEVLKIAHH
jgi:hypothetical protein